LAATDTIGQVQTIYLQTVDNLRNTYETNVSSKFAIKPTATYGDVNGALRSLNNLTTNTYIDTKLITMISVNEEVAEE